MSEQHTSELPGKQMVYWIMVLENLGFFLAGYCEAGTTMQGLCCDTRFAALHDDDDDDDARLFNALVSDPTFSQRHPCRCPSWRWGWLVKTIWGGCRWAKRCHVMDSVARLAVTYSRTRGAFNR